MRRKRWMKTEMNGSSGLVMVMEVKSRKGVYEWRLVGSGGVGISGERMLVLVALEGCILSLYMGPPYCLWLFCLFFM